LEGRLADFDFLYDNRMSLDINDGRADDGAFERIEGKRLTYRPTSQDRSSQAGRETIAGVPETQLPVYGRDVMNLFGREGTNGC
jgi:hypothetical protein